MHRFAEFFAGAGMVRAALSRNWDVALANDIDPKKCASYVQNWGGHELVQGDIADLEAKALFQPIDLYWASSPCQDFSLAGQGKGLGGLRSGVFHHWVNLIKQSSQRGFAPKILAFENVRGLLTRNQGYDFVAVLAAFKSLGYRFGALEIDASLFLPQSRPRVFVVAMRNDIEIDPRLVCTRPQLPFHSDKLQGFQSRLSEEMRREWVWWHLPAPPPRTIQLSDVLSEDGAWMDQVSVNRILHMMDPSSHDRIMHLRGQAGSHFGTIYKRGRPDASGVVRQRAETRFDGLAGCLRTPAGGSSKQTVVLVKNGTVKMRLMTPREAMRLMGVPESYMLPDSYNDGYKLAGDGVAVAVVEYLDKHLLSTLVRAPAKQVAA